MVPASELQTVHGFDMFAGMSAFARKLLTEMERSSVPGVSGAADDVAIELCLRGLIFNLKSVTVEEQTVVGGAQNKVSGTLQLDCPAPYYSFTVPVTSSNGAVVVPSDVLVQAGATTRAFAFVTKRVTVPTTVELSFESNEGFSVAVPIAVVPQ